PAQSQAAEPQVALEMCKQHLNAFSIVARSLECFSLGLRASNVTSFLVNVRGTLRKGAFGQQCAFNGQLRQWRMLAIYRSVSPSLTSLPVVVSVLPAGQMYTFRSLSNVKSS